TSCSISKALADGPHPTKATCTQRTDTRKCRIYTAEETVASIKASERWQTNGPETKKRRNVNGVTNSDRTPTNKVHPARAGSTSLSLDGLPSHIDAATFLRSFSNGSSNSAPPTSHIEHMACPMCGKASADTLMMSQINSSFDGSPN
ncbi:uncharacterized protein EDB93DRAFT_889605, partial [Suillus bovinus]|uniref:uncharacterized protein n=1 Tax=Suillus bovinus TaxID=48563 RepID=UPI001B87EECD